MDLDSIIYIVIAIVLAIINAIAQKKKKAAQQQATPKAPAVDIFSELGDEELVEEDPKEPIKSFQDILREMANESFTEEDKQIANQPVIIEQPLDFIEQQPVESEIDIPVSPIDSPVVVYKPIDIPEGAIDSIGEYDYNSVENSIASSAISDALTEEEEMEKIQREQNLIVKNFNPKDAIIYSEIIKPKYF